MIHCKISSSNVLLNPLPNNGWLAKITDYGMANAVQGFVETMDSYSAPEASVLSLQSTKMDIFSVGVLLLEMCTGQLPVDGREREHLLHTVHHKLSDLVRRCVDPDRDNRPTAEKLLSDLEQF